MPAITVQNKTIGWISDRMKKYVPGCLGVTVGLLAALGIIFAILMPLGINNWFLINGSFIRRPRWWFHAI